MIAARGCHDAVGSFRVCERENGIGSPANFERAGFLEVFALEEKLRACHGIQRL
jgi:hypothetical protein